MSAGQLSGKTLSLAKLYVDGQEVQGGAGTLLSLTGDATGSVATTSASVAVSVSGTAQTGVLTTASTMVLPPPGSGGGGVTSLTGTGGTPATGAVAFTSSVTSGASTALSFVPSANGMELSGTVGGSGGGIPSVQTTSGTTPATLTGAVILTGSAIVSTDATTGTITLNSGAGSGIPSLTTTPATAGTGNGAVAFSTEVTTTAGAPTAVWTGATGSMKLALNIPPAGGGTGISPIAYGTITVPASPGVLFNAYIPGSTAPATPNVALTVVGGTLPATFTANTFWTINSCKGGTAVAPPNSAVNAPLLSASQTYVGIGAGGAFTAGQILNWILWVA